MKTNKEKYIVLIDYCSFQPPEVVHWTKTKEEAKKVAKKWRKPGRIIYVAEIVETFVD